MIPASPHWLTQDLDHVATIIPTTVFGHLRTVLLACYTMSDQSGASPRQAHQQLLLSSHPYICMHPAPLGFAAFSGPFMYVPELPPDPALSTGAVIDKPQAPTHLSKFTVSSLFNVGPVS